MERDVGIETGEAIFGHAPFEPNPNRNMPTPSIISSRLEVAALRRSESQNGSPLLGRTRGNSEPTPQLEKEHVVNLRRHYASHCQMCLCERAPGELAPKDSYIEWEEVRRRVIEAHHVDLKSGGGARHAGNIILLCKLHHDNFGRRFTRASITTTLRKNSQKKSIQFAANSEVKGRKVMLEIPDTGEIIQLFFTNEHAEYWLSEYQNRIVNTNSESE